MQSRASKASKWDRWWKISAVLGTLALGTLASAWRLWQADQRIRYLFKEEATLISWALRSDYIDTLKGTTSDLDDIYYQRLKSQLLKTKQFFPYYASIFVAGEMPDGTYRYLAHSETDDLDFAESRLVLDEVSETLIDVFEGKKAITFGPENALGRNVASTLVPLLHPFTDDVVAIMGVDVDAKKWRVSLVQSLYLPVLTTIVLLGVLLVFFLLNDNASPASRPRIEIYGMAALGIVCTTALAVAIDQNERFDRQINYRRGALVQANSLQQSLYRIGDIYLEGIARLFESSTFVDKREFNKYTAFLLNRPYARYWAWLPLVPMEDRAQFESLVRQTGDGEFAIWEKNREGERVEVRDRAQYLPVCYIEPRKEYQQLVGLDYNADPKLSSALEKSLHGKLPVATDPIFSGDSNSGKCEIVVFRSVTGPDNKSPVQGVVTATLQMHELLLRVLGRESAADIHQSRVELYQLNKDREPIFLTSSDKQNLSVLKSNTREFVGLEGLLHFVAPIFAFGQVYAIASEPDAGFIALHPARDGIITFLVGIVLTGLISVLMYILFNRKAVLEKEVMARTADLKNSEESYRGLFNAIQQTICIQDEQGRFVDVNEGAVSRYGYQRDEFVGRTMDFLSAPGRNNLDHVRDCFAAAWKGKPQYFEFWGLCKNGEVFPTDVWLCKGRYAGKDVVIAVALDVSTRKKTEEEHQRLQVQFLQSQKMESIGRLAGGVAHDFNNMLQAIIGNANLAKQRIPPGLPIEEYLNEIELSAQRSAQLTRQLLAFASKQTIQPRIIDLNDTVGGMLKMLQRLIGENIQLTWAPGANLWPVKMDPGQVDQILTNLMINSRDAIKGAGWIKIETVNRTCNSASCTSKNCSASRPCQHVVLSVSDNGSGMDEEVREHLFEPFYTTKEPGKGTGLGLATVFGIVNQNRGIIDVSSSPGKGTHIQIRIPRDESSATPSVTEPAAKSAMGGSETILIVEDEAAILQMSRISLQRIGYKVLTAPDPKTALTKVREYSGTIHLLITDMVLPGINGSDLIKEVSLIKPETRSLIMSGYSADAVANSGQLDVSVNFIQKPFTIPDLAIKIRTILDREDGTANKRVL